MNGDMNKLDPRCKQLTGDCGTEKDGLQQEKQCLISETRKIRRQPQTLPGAGQAESAGITLPLRRHGMVKNV